MSRMVRAASPSDKRDGMGPGSMLRTTCAATTGWRLAIMREQSAQLAEDADGEVLTALRMALALVVACAAEVEMLKKSGTDSPTDAGPSAMQQHHPGRLHVRQQWDHLQLCLVLI